MDCSVLNLKLGFCIAFLFILISMESTNKLELIDQAIQNLLAEKKNKQASADDNDQLLLSKLFSELESHKQSQESTDREEPNSASIGKEKLKKENGGSTEIAAEEIMKELRNVKRQNIVTHCLLSALIVLTITWQISEVSLFLKLKNGLSHPFKSFGSMVLGMLKGPGTNGQDADKQQQTEGHSRPPLHMPELPHMGSNGENK